MSTDDVSAILFFGFQLFMLTQFSIGMFFVMRRMFADSNSKHRDENKAR